MTPSPELPRVLSDEQIAVRNFARAVVALCDDKAASYKKAAHPFNDKFGDNPERLVAARAKEEVCRELSWDIRTEAEKTLRALASAVASALPAASPQPWKQFETFGYSLAAQVLQSDVYRQLDDRARAECDELLARGLHGPAASSPAPAPAASDAPDADAQLTGERAKKAWALIRFLDGRAPLEGLWFGEKSGPAPYWWRKYLPSLTSAALQYPAAAPALVPAGDALELAAECKRLAGQCEFAELDPDYPARVNKLHAAIDRLASRVPAGDVVAMTDERLSLAFYRVAVAMTALHEIEWSNDSAWQSQRAREAIAALKAGQADTPQVQGATSAPLRAE